MAYIIEYSDDARWQMYLPEWVNSMYGVGHVRYQDDSSDSLYDAVMRAEIHREIHKNWDQLMYINGREVFTAETLSEGGMLIRYRDRGQHVLINPKKSGTLVEASAITKENINE